jgi:hypothetical protein
MLFVKLQYFWRNLVNSTDFSNNVHNQLLVFLRIDKQSSAVLLLWFLNLIRPNMSLVSTKN